MRTGLRRSKTVNGETTQHIWDGQNMAAEKAVGQTTNYIRSNRLVASEKAGVKSYYLYNVHGDVSMLTDGSQNIPQSYQYDAFGNQKNLSDTDLNPFRYCGEYYDSETGDIYLRARYYDSGVGRFNTEDPALDGLNWYVYCMGNPVNHFDPSGMKFAGSDRECTIAG